MEEEILCEVWSVDLEHTRSMLGNPEVAEHKNWTPNIYVNKRVSAGYSNTVRGFFHAAWIVFALSLACLALGFVLGSKLTIAFCAFGVAIATGLLGECIRRANEERE